MSTEVAWLVPRGTAAVSGAISVYTIHPYTNLQCHFIQSHTGRVYVCLAVTCHLHFWWNDRDLLHASAVTQGWNGYRNKSQHRKLTLEKILPPLLPGLESGTFRSRVWRYNHWAIPAPHKWLASRKTWNVEELESLPAGTKPRTSHHRSPGGERRGKTKR